MAGRNTVENVDVTLTATDKASKPIDEVAKGLDELDDKDVAVAVDDQATPDLKEIDRTADQAAADREMTIRSAGMGDILDDLRSIQTDAQKTQDQISEIGSAGDRAGGGIESGMGKISSGLSQLPGPIGDIGQAFNDAGDAAEGIGGKVAGLTPILGAVGGAALLFWNQFQSEAEEAKRKVEEVKAAQLSMASGDITQATALLADAYGKYGKQLEAAGISQADFANMITNNIPLTDAQTKALADQLGIIGLSSKSVEDLRKTWADQAAEITNAQQAQFEMSKALGATTDQLLAQAGQALPAVQKQILSYIAAQNGIPESVITSVLTDADPDDVAQVKKILDDLAKQRDANIAVDQTGASTAGSEIDFAARDRSTTISVNAAISQANAAIRNILSFGGGGGGGGRAAPLGPTGRGVGPAALAGVPAYSVAAPAVYQINVYTTPGAPTPDIARSVAAALDRHERTVGARRRARS